MKRFWRTHKLLIGGGGACVLVYFATRLIAISPKVLPMFVDEAIYSLWAQQGFYDPSLRLVSLVDGKQPLFIWLTSLAMFLARNPLAAGRIVSVIAGLLTAVGLFLLATRLFRNRWAGFAAAAVYILLPFALVVNRMAIYESVLGALFVWNLYLSILLVQTLRIDVALTLGLVLGAGLLTKTTSFLSIDLLPLTLLLFVSSKKELLLRLVRWTALVALAVSVSLLVYSVLRLSPLFNVIEDKNARFIYHLRELIPNHAFFAWPGNVAMMTGWLVTYITPSIAFIAAVALFLPDRIRKEKLLLLGWFLIAFLGLGLFGRIIYPRFIYPLLLPLLPLAGYTLAYLGKRIKRRGIFGPIVLTVLALPVFVDYRILTDFARAPLPAVTSFDYSNGWPAGGGIREIMAYLSDQSKTQSIFIVSEGTYGSLPTTALEIYFRDNARVSWQGLEPVPVKVPKRLVEKAKEIPVYIIFNRIQNPPNWPMDLVVRYQKGVGNWYISLYKLRNGTPVPCDMSYAKPEEEPLLCHGVSSQYVSM